MKKYKIGPWSLKLQHQRQQRGQGGDGDGNEGGVSEETEQHVRNCLHLGFEFQLKLRHLRVDKLTKALVSKDDDGDENGASRSTLETTETVPASSSKSNNEKNDKYPPVAVLVGDKFDNPEYFLWDKDKCQMLEWTPRRVRKYQQNSKGKRNGSWVERQGTATIPIYSNIPLQFRTLSSIPSLPP